MNTLSTCGFGKYFIPFQLDNETVLNCMILDTAGQEKFNSLIVTYYKKADAVLLVYDISKKSSFDKIRSYYVEKIRDNCKKDIPILLLGNKTDLDGENKREVLPEEGIDLALKEKYEFLESSCIRNENVAGAFEALIKSWNFEIHRKQNNLIRTNSKDKIKNNNIIKKSFTCKNLCEGMEETVIKRTSSCTIANDKERKEKFQLKLTSEKKRKNKCC